MHKTLAITSTKRNAARSGLGGLEFCRIREDRAGQRLDNFLFWKLKSVPKSHIYRMIRKGSVKVNGKRKAPEYKLCLDDEVRFPSVKLDVDALREKTSPSSKSIELVENCIIFENDDFLIINKPPGIAAHGGSGINFGVIELLRHARSDMHYLELAHRLDRETSGCMLIAKKRSFLRCFHELLRKGDLTKRYVALLKGELKENTIRIDAPLIKNVRKSGERVVLVDEQEGKNAITIFKKVRSFGTIATLVEVILKTGKTHQIRVHAAHIGHPIALDEKYGDKDFNKFMKSKGLSRLFLHANSLEFYGKPADRDEIPKAGQRSRPQIFRIKAELDKNLLHFLQHIEK